MPWKIEFGFRAKALMAHKRVLEDRVKVLRILSRTNNAKPKQMRAATFDKIVDNGPGNADATLKIQGQRE